MLIVIGGLPAVGKTSLSREVARGIGAVHLRIDTIEQALRGCGVPVEAEGYRVAQAVAEDNLRLGRSVVADCVNPWPQTRDEWRAVAGRAGVRALEVEVICSDRAEHRRRAETREADIPGLRLPDWRELAERDYRPWDRPRLIIDTARLGIQDAVAAIVDAMSPGPGR